MIPAALPCGAAPAQRWRLADRLKLLSWGDAGGDVVFAPHSRTTHLVDSTAGAVLQSMLEHGGHATLATLLTELRSPPPPDTHRLADELQADADAGADQDSAALSACLQGLMQAGLLVVEPEAPA